MNSTQILPEETLPLPIPRQNIETALTFAREQSEPQKAEQVGLNTLAVLALRNYLDLMAIATNLEGSDSWNPVLRTTANVADLIISNIGQLECMPVRINANASLSSEQFLGSIPPEVRWERIGYSVVGIDEKERVAVPLGFVKTAGTGEIYVRDLQDLPTLLDYLANLARDRVHLNLWFAALFSANWQAPESLLPSTSETAMPSNPTSSPWWQNLADAGRQAWERLVGEDGGDLEPAGLAFRRGNEMPFPEADVCRAKLIDLGISLNDRAIVLLVALAKQADERIKILVRANPEPENPYLPQNLQLALVGDNGEILQSVTSRNQDLYILLKPFTVDAGTDFQLRVSLDSARVEESFSV
ncbi:MAG: DUF1822 family protein [Cyanobacteria bacterium SBLK]|nr:DUF1822 family protein [Cyanobacteria bacterium SBLK]